MKSSVKAIRVSEDIVPVSDFKARAAAWFQRIVATRQPLIITQNGKAAGVLLSPAEFDRLTERARFVSAIEEGIADADAGRVRSHEEVIALLKKRAGTRAKR